jgi:Uncharacterised protein family (UPF0149)
VSARHCCLGGQQSGRSYGETVSETARGQRPLNGRAVAHRCRISPDDSMGLSDLDGFLTGVVVGPELILPSEWLPVVWGGAEPQFETLEEMRTVLGAIMGRYNESPVSTVIPRSSTQSYGRGRKVR